MSYVKTDYSTYGLFCINAYPCVSPVFMQKSEEPSMKEEWKHEIDEAPTGLSSETSISEEGVS